MISHFDFSNLLKILHILIAVDPKFSAPILNLTVPVSRDAIFTCHVHDLFQYKVSLSILHNCFLIKWIWKEREWVRSEDRDKRGRKNSRKEKWRILINSHFVTDKCKSFDKASTWNNDSYFFRLILVTSFFLLQIMWVGGGRKETL